MLGGKIHVLGRTLPPGKEALNRTQGRERG